MFDTLTDRLQGALRSLAGTTRLSAENIEEAIRAVRKALLEADVSLKVVKLFIARVRRQALGVEVLESVTPAQQFIKVVHDELVAILGSENVPINLKGDPAIVMLLGLQGSGKTTACGKLALRLKKDKLNPLLVALDIQRPAAITQLKTLGKQIEVPVFALEDSKDVTEIASLALAEARRLSYNPLILDTAGRLQIDTELMAELLLLDRVFEPAEKLLVVDAMTGQEAVNVAETFNTQLDLTGIILTKVDGDARGGAALSVRESVGRPIKYMSTGEKLPDLEAFYPDRMASRILGMGDVLSLVEKAQEQIDEREAEKMARQMMEGQFTLDMFVGSRRMMQKMGSLSDIMKMMGLGSMLGMTSDQQNLLASQGETMFKLYETAINSMTPTERLQPNVINMSRRRRIAAGAGLKENLVGQMLKEFEQMRQMFQHLRGMLGGMGPLSAMIPGGGLPAEFTSGGSGQLPGGSLPPAFKTKRRASSFPFGGSSYYRKKGKRPRS